jgi:hypothetical protein
VAEPRSLLRSCISDFRTHADQELSWCWHAGHLDRHYSHTMSPVSSSSLVYAIWLTGVRLRTGWNGPRLEAGEKGKMVGLVAAQFAVHRLALAGGLWRWQPGRWRESWHAKRPVHDHGHRHLGVAAALDDCSAYSAMRRVIRTRGCAAWTK